MSCPPPLRQLIRGTAPERLHARRYWLEDPVVAAVQYLLMHLFRWLPIDWASDFGAWGSRLSPRRYPASDARARRAWARLRPEADPPSTDDAIRRIWRSTGFRRRRTSNQHGKRFARSARTILLPGDFTAKSSGRPFAFRAATSTDYRPQASASGETCAASASSPRRVSGCSGASGWRTASERMTPPSFMTAFVARNPHCRFS